MTEALVLGPESLKAFFRKLCIVTRRRYLEENNRAKIKARIALVRDALPKKQKELANFLERDLSQTILKPTAYADIVTLPKDDYEALTTILKHLTKRIEQLEKEKDGGNFLSKIATLAGASKEGRVTELRDKIAFLEEVLAYKQKQKKHSGIIKKLQDDIADLKTLLVDYG